MLANKLLEQFGACRGPHDDTGDSHGCSESDVKVRTTYSTITNPDVTARADTRVNADVAELQLKKREAQAGQIPRFYFEKPTPSSIATCLHKANREIDQKEILNSAALARISKAICSVCERRDGLDYVPLDQAYLSVQDLHQV